ncbi:hypothetical protein SAMN05443144_1493 [Fodinibius roseus]|uniref:Uncharacterized protein n=1 Tax=Fodinibius roseus TaxID=1194090 RepID=A0A1M5M2U8_9BACT|nr:hypothetical protein [Fodinibius roseus]SHG71043.1 hypothetical protein SAMN05443144_1493 [Fodinibius roseus]
MDHFLRTDITVPIEREYERWIINGIENYFESLNVQYQNFAISPDLEKKYPADEFFFHHSFKLFGLQFKKAIKAKNKKEQTGINCDRLKWELHNPSGQFNLIKNKSELFYCLPTFINRNYKKEALNHALFWRPDKSNTDMATWYDNSGARTSNKHLKNEMRWGLFAEKLMCCDIGIRHEFDINNPEGPATFLNNYINQLLGYLSDFSPDTLEEETIIYLFIVANF